MLGHIFEKVEEGFISLLIVGMTLLVFVEVVLRFGFNTGGVWVEELVLHMGAWLILFGASYGVKKNVHIGVDAVVNMMGAKLRRRVGIIAILLSLLYCGLFMIAAWNYLAKLYLIGIEMEDLPIPSWLGKSILLIGFAMLGVRIFQLLINVLQGKSTGFVSHNEAEDALEEIKDQVVETGAKKPGREELDSVKNSSGGGGS
ncbi:MAG: TRAP transporter small permease [Halopseudomonas sp.]